MRLRTKKPKHKDVLARNRGGDNRQLEEKIQHALRKSCRQRRAACSESAARGRGKITRSRCRCSEAAEIETESPAEKAAKNELRQRLAEMEHAESLQRERQQPQQPQQSQQPQQAQEP